MSLQKDWLGHISNPWFRKPAVVVFAILLAPVFAVVTLLDHSAQAAQEFFPGLWTDARTVARVIGLAWKGRP